MEIFRLQIWLKAKGNVNSICQNVQRLYALKSEDSRTYPEYVREQWDSEQQRRELYSLYPADSLVACEKISQCTYYIFEAEPSNSIEQATLHVLVVSELEDIGRAYDIVYKDLRRKVRKDFGMKMVEPNVVRYICSGSDIISPEACVKADIVRGLCLTKPEKYRLAIMVILLAAGVLISQMAGSSLVRNDAYAALIAGIAALISEILVKIKWTSGL